MWTISSTCKSFCFLASCWLNAFCKYQMMTFAGCHPQMIRPMSEISYAVLRVKNLHWSFRRLRKFAGNCIQWMYSLNIIRLCMANFWSKTYFLSKKSFEAISLLEKDSHHVKQSCRTAPDGWCWSFFCEISRTFQCFKTQCQITLISCCLEKMFTKHCLLLVITKHCLDVGCLDL